MNVVGRLFVVLLAHQAIAGTVRSPPAFSKPVYSDSYLPAAMQVIFHAVEQLKLAQSDERREVVSSTTPICLESDTQTQSSSSTTMKTTTGQAEEGKEKDGGSKEASATSNRVETTTKLLQTKENTTNSGHQKLSEAGPSYRVPTEASSIYQEPSEMNAETPELNYATPETNYESPETEHAVQETNEEIPEVDQEAPGSSPIVPEAGKGSIDVSGTSSKPGSIEQTKKVPTIDSVVQEVYEIVKPTASGLLDLPIGESKGFLPASAEKLEILEDEDDENRFTRLGERVTQVPRPSLTSYLRRAKVPPSATLQQLANLYDSLSKDARKQGFGKYTGYSDEVLNTLETFAEGGVAPQLKKILDKVLERNELTRDDARTRTRQAIRDLDDPSSTLSRELRPLLPLRYSP
ncbi:ecdysone-inducible gene E3 [Megalopta genalis]|uniref:ecdysone-inducible gene E3 n=1 Tax=Megalopta genalis TaxID=115081 RepID=UPI003FD23996